MTGCCLRCDLQEEERERRLDFVPEESALQTTAIEVRSGAGAVASRRSSKHRRGCRRCTSSGSGANGGEGKVQPISQQPCSSKGEPLPMVHRKRTIEQPAAAADSRRHSGLAKGGGAPCGH